MDLTIIYTIASLASLGILSAIVLFIVAAKFKVYENPLIAEVDEILPGANCAGCGSPGCKSFAEKLVNSEDISDLFCPVGGNDTMQQVAKILGKEVKEQDPMVAVIRCQGTCIVRPKINKYEGPSSCQINAMIYAGETACQYGCLGHGECVDACTFDAMHLDMETGMPVIVSENCTACGACIPACPRDLIELRPKRKRDLKIYVGCMNEEKGGIAKKACEAACIGCSKCLKECPKDAITIENNLAYIDPIKCTLCRKCVPVCPTNSIIETNFPPRKEKKVEKKAEKKVEKKKLAVEAIDITESVKNEA